MRKNVALFFMLLLLTHLSAYALENGLYLVSNENSGVEVITQDDEKHYLGNKQDIQILNARMHSKNNENTVFYFEIEFKYIKNLDKLMHILVVDNIGYESNGGGYRGEEASSISFNLLNQVNAEQVAKFFAIPLNLREHPGHKLAVSFTPEKEKYFVGEEVKVMFKIKNLGENTISFSTGGFQRFSNRDNQYTFCGEYPTKEGTKQLLDIGSSDNSGGLVGTQTLKQGDIFEDEITLSKWFTFDHPGFYSIYGIYYMQYGDPMTVQWEDYVTARFFVKVLEKNPNASH